MWMWRRRAALIRRRGDKGRAPAGGDPSLRSAFRRRAPASLTPARRLNLRSAPQTVHNNYRLLRHLRLESQSKKATLSAAAEHPISSKRSTDGFNNPADWALSQSNDEGAVSPLEP